MSSSTVDGPKKLLSPPNQARDIVAIIKALGFEKASIFANSLGGIFGFQLAVDHPEMINHLICHENPTVMLIPDASERFERILLLQHAYRESGLLGASQLYSPKFPGYDDPGLEKPGSPPHRKLGEFL
ncbi:hypothetical protein BP5796_12246 [Coleophoma crateriformis]|uniref:AB hydrolase-1 domain-containing protein n=1 Tax=Coleophoma crateriformis TaxID=565419 RepID=A0A3D8Q917_9HELO|nr:hypothetical protein BP5796_12246 [Coleophoma crateriformis]